MPLGPGRYIVGEEECTKKIRLDASGCFFREDDSAAEIRIVGVGLATIFAPPQNTLRGIPYLSIKFDGKSYKAECKQCLIEGSTQLCSHPEHLRSFEETYHLFEFSHAIKLGTVLFLTSECSVKKFILCPYRL